MAIKSTHTQVLLISQQNNKHYTTKAVAPASLQKVHAQTIVGVSYHEHLCEHRKHETLLGVLGGKLPQSFLATLLGVLERSTYVCGRATVHIT